MPEFLVQHFLQAAPGVWSFRDLMPPTSPQTSHLYLGLHSPGFLQVALGQAICRWPLQKIINLPAHGMLQATLLEAKKACTCMRNKPQACCAAHGLFDMIEGPCSSIKALCSTDFWYQVSCGTPPFG